MSNAEKPVQDTRQKRVTADELLDFVDQALKMAARAQQASQQPVVLAMNETIARVHDAAKSVALNEVMDRRRNGP